MYLRRRDYRRLSRQSGRRGVTQADRVPASYMLRGIGGEVAGSKSCRRIRKSSRRIPMPRSYPPPLQSTPQVKAFELSQIDRQRLARPLDQQTLSPQVTAAISHAIAVYKATRHGAHDTTKGTTLAALAQVTKPGREYEKAVSRLADDRSGVDYSTLEVVKPLAMAVLAGDVGAKQALAEAAAIRAAALREIPRVAPRAEALRFFCGVLKLIFDNAAATTVERTWANCGKFALEVFGISGIETADFEAHPERLTKYLRTDVSSG